jgi:hypothetical protein
MKKLSLYWFLAAVFGIAIIAADRLWGWSSPVEPAFLLIVTVFATIVVLIKSGSLEPDYKKLARSIEMHNPELKATLLTAIEQKPKDLGGELGYLQERVIGEALAHARTHNWIESIPRSRLVFAGGTNIASLIFFLFILSHFSMPALSFLSPNKSGRSSEPRGYELTVTPGDTTVELGTPVVILARFDGKVPGSAKLFVGSSEENIQEIPFNKNLEDPVFGGIISQVSSDMLYRIEYDDSKTRDYKIQTYQHPALEQADANIVYPAYTKLPNREIKNTLRLSGVVEGSNVTLTFALNKPVVTAQLVPQSGPALDLTVNSENPSIYTTHIEPRESLRYELKLVDSDGRANKAPPRFVINIVKNTPPNLKLKFPNRDVEASPLEELTLEAEVSDDFGITSQGVSYILAGSQANDIVIPSRETAVNKKEDVEYVLAMENLNVQPNQLLSYYFWAEDVDPDGKTRRTVSDLYFAEVRPFEQIFRENQSFMDQNQQERERQQQEQQNQEGMQNDQQRREQLVQLQKQIISATWNVKRQTDLSPNGVENNKEDINLVKESQASALDMARSGGDQPGGMMGPMGQRSTGPTRGGGRGRRRSMPPRSGGMNQISPPPANAENTSSEDPMEQAIKHMEDALEHLQETLDKSTSEELLQALASEQAAYQELLKLREQESEVARDRSGQQSNQNRSARSQQQLQQLEMRQRNDRYETQSQAQQQRESQQQDNQQREDLQVLNRLRDLARRQNEMTNRLREAESALREAQNEQQRQEIQRELERLREEQVQNLRDVDELQQRMENQQNRQRMSDSAEQLSQTRERMQQSAEQMQQGQVSEAAANSTRAQRELEQMRDEFQRNTSGQFSQQMQDMRQQARELDEEQQQISQQMRQQQSGAQQNALGQPGTNQELADRLGQQRENLQDLLEQMRDVSEQSEESEPLLSRRLYDTYREASTANVDRALQTTEELLRRNFAPQAQSTEEQAREGIQNLREGIEEAARGVLGDEADSLRLAREQLNEAIRQIDPNQAENLQAREGTQGQRSRDPNNPLASESFLGNRQGERNFDPNQEGDMQARSSTRGQRGFDPNEAGNMQARGGTRGQRGFDPNQAGNMQARGGTRGQRGFDPNQAGNMQARVGTRGQRGFDPNEAGNMQARDGTRGQGSFDPNEAGDMQARGGTRGQRGFDPNEAGNMQARGGTRGQGSFDPNEAGDMQARSGTRGGRGFDPNQTDNMQARGERGQQDLRNFVNRLRNQANPNGLGNFGPYYLDEYDPNNNPLTGENFRQWSDALREVEEMLSDQELREQVATARERARTMREDFTRNSDEPQWDMVQLDVVKPLAEVRNRISEELAKIESREAIVPIDRDPVPARYSDLVRAYYENLGGDN